MINYNKELPDFIADSFELDYEEIHERIIIDFLSAIFLIIVTIAGGISMFFFENIPFVKLCALMCVVAILVLAYSIYKNNCLKQIKKGNFNLTYAICKQATVLGGKYKHIEYECITKSNEPLTFSVHHHHPTASAGDNVIILSYENFRLIYKIPAS